MLHFMSNWRLKLPVSQLCRIEELIGPLPEEHSPVHGECRCRELRLVAERAHRLYFIAPCDVVCIQAYGNYVRIHVGRAIAPPLVLVPAISDRSRL